MQSVGNSHRRQQQNSLLDGFNDRHDTAVNADWKAWLIYRARRRLPLYLLPRHHACLCVCTQLKLPSLNIKRRVSHRRRCPHPSVDGNYRGDIELSRHGSPYFFPKLGTRVSWRGVGNDTALFSSACTSPIRRTSKAYHRKTIANRARAAHSTYNVRDVAGTSTRGRSAACSVT